ncbi:MAG: hypothetical protein GVY19_01815 [Bacteroidetes bacterium]|jgi:hypothetical protein|nr:hypothetical protein [Bacteroidota bacterium]
MKIRNLLSYTIIIFVGGLLAGCVSGPADNKSGNGDETTVNAFDQVNDQLKEVYYRFPSPDEMFSYVRQQSLEFDPTLLIPVKQSRKFIDSKSQKVGLGMYVSDLAYITLFERYKESMDYMRVIHSLSEEVRIAGAFDQQFAERIEANIRNMDSLKVISNDALDKLVSYLVSNNMEETFALISMGGFVEVVYISTQLVDKYEPDDETIQRIAEQKFVLKNLLEYVNIYKNDAAVKETMNTIQPIVDFYNNLEKKEQSETKVQKQDDGKLIFSGGSDLYLTEDQFNELKTTAANIRKAMLYN